MKEFYTIYDICDRNVLGQLWDHFVGMSGGDYKSGAFCDVAVDYLEERQVQLHQRFGMPVELPQLARLIEMHFILGLKRMDHPAPARRVTPGTVDARGVWHEVPVVTRTAAEAEAMFLAPTTQGWHTVADWFQAGPPPAEPQPEAAVDLNAHQRDLMMRMERDMAEARYRREINRPGRGHADYLRDLERAVIQLEAEAERNRNGQAD